MASHSKAPLRAVGINSFKGDTKLVQVGRKDSHVLSHLHRQKTTAQSTAKHQHNRWNKASYTFLNSLLATPKVSQNKKILYGQPGIYCNAEQEFFMAFTDT